MARGDVKHQRTSYRSGGSSRSYSTQSSIKAEEAYSRKMSLAAYEEVKAQASPGQYLLNTSNLLSIYRDTNAIVRKGDYDWNRIKGLLQPGQLEAVLKAIEEAKAAEQAAAEQRRIEREQRWQEYQAEQAREAERREQEEAQQKLDILANSQLMLGSLQSETSEVFRRSERYELDTGDYLEDPVSSRLRSGGWIEDTHKRAGFRLQLSISLDVSNSNWYNGVAPHAIRAFQEIVLAARALKEEQPESVVYSAWLFSKNRDGKGTEQLVDYKNQYDWNTGRNVKVEIEDPLKETVKLFGAGKSEPSYAGEDSYIYPLFQAIKAWEDAEVGPGYVKLDIILSDGVFERKVDITTADEIQAQRGQCHSVVLNFMPEEEWYEGRLPFQVVQYGVTGDNVNGMLRLVLASFLEAYL